MITVPSAVTTELATGTSPIDWYVDLQPRDGTYNFRIKTSNSVPDRSGYQNAALLTKPISLKKQLGGEFDKYNIEISIADSGVTSTIVDRLLGEIADKTIDQATVTIGMYCASNEQTIDICRVFKIDVGETTLKLTATNEIDAFTGKLGEFHEPQSWDRVEDGYDNPDPTSPFEQLNTQAVVNSNTGRYRKGQKVTGSERQGYAQWWNPKPYSGKDEDPFMYPIAFGQKLIISYEKRYRGEPVVLSQGQTGKVYQVMNSEGAITGDWPSGISPKQWSDSTYRDPFDENVFCVDDDESPRYTALSGLNRSTGKIFVVYDGIEHYSYNNLGVKQTLASAHGGYTSPIWVFLHIAMNYRGVRWDQIDWASAYATATSLQSAGYDLRFILKEPKKVKEILDKITLNGSFLYSWTGGKLYFSRREPEYLPVGSATPNPNFQGYQLNFTNTDIIEDSFNVSDQGIQDQPNKFTLNYLVQGQDSEDRYYMAQLSHPIKIMDVDYTKDNTKTLDLNYLYDPDDLAWTTTGDSLPLLEAIKEIRMSRVQDRFTFSTKNLNAMLLQGGDPVTVTYLLNTLDIDTQPCEVESVSYNGANTVQVTLKPRQDTWFEPDPSIGINTAINWDNIGALESNIPSFRFVASGNATGSTVYLRNFANQTNGNDIRALAPGNQLYTISPIGGGAVGWGQVSSNTGDTRYWQYLGEIASVITAGASGSEYIVVTLTDTIATTCPTYYWVQAQPRATHYKVSKNGNAYWKMGLDLFFTDDWDYMTSSSSNKLDDDGGESTAASYDSDLTMSWLNGEKVLSSTVSFPTLTSDYTYANFPGCVAFRIKTLNGVIGTEDVYCFSNNISVNADIPTDTVTDAAVSFDSDNTILTEAGLTIVTNWNSADNPNVKLKIEWDDQATWATAFGTIYGIDSAFKGLKFTEDQAANSFIEDITFTEQITLKLTTYKTDGVTTVGSADYLTLTKVNHMWDVYIGTINTYTGSTNKGAAMLLATTAYGLVNPNFTRDSAGSNDYEDWSGGVYIFAANNDTNMLNKRRYGIDPVPYSAGTYNYEPNGPVTAFEANGDSKISYWNDGTGLGAYTATTYTPHEYGNLFYAFLDNSTEKGEVNLGLSKTYGRQFYFYSSNQYVQSGTQHAKSDGSIPNQGVGTTLHRGAALVVCRSSYSDTRFNPNVFASNLAVQGLLIGGQTDRNPSSTTKHSLSFPDDIKKGRIFLTMTASELGISDTDYSTEMMLISGNQNAGGAENWHGYVYANETGLVIPQLYNITFCTNTLLKAKGGFGIPVHTKSTTGSNTYDTTYIAASTNPKPYIFEHGKNMALLPHNNGSAPPSYDNYEFWLSWTGTPGSGATYRISMWTPDGKKELTFA